VVVDVPAIHENVHAGGAVFVNLCFEYAGLPLDALDFRLRHLDRVRVVALNAQVEVARACAGPPFREDEAHAEPPAEEAEVASALADHEGRQCLRDDDAGIVLGSLAAHRDHLIGRQRARCRRVSGHLLVDQRELNGQLDFQ
jgi:hypothetical protein